MKKRNWIILGMLLAVTSMLQAQDARNYLWSFSHNEKTYEIGLYGTITMQYAEVFNQPAGYLGGEFAAIINHKWAVGWKGNALYYDRRLNELAENGTYHLEAGYAGIFGEYFWHVGKKLRVGMSLFSGTGLAQYRYDYEYREDKLWHEEIIDQKTFATLEAGLELSMPLANNWRVSLNDSCRTSSPVYLYDTDPYFIQGLNAGIGFKWGFF